jgi:hypothetical protein
MQQAVEVSKWKCDSDESLEVLLNMKSLHFNTAFNVHVLLYEVCITETRRLMP